MAQSTRTPSSGVPSARNNTPIYIGVIAVVVVLAVIAIVVAVVSSSKDSSDASSTPTAEWQAVTVSGTKLPQLPQNSTGTDAAIGMTAPTLQGSTFTDTPVSITNDGKAKAVMFVAHWCPHCQREVPLLSKWITDNKSKYPDVEFFAVATATQSDAANFPPSAWLQREKFPVAAMADDRNNTAATAYGLGAYPYLVFLDKNNKVVSRTSGEIPMTQFEQYVQAAESATA